MDAEGWREVDRYLTETVLRRDAAAVGVALAANAAAGLPPIDVSAPQGRLLELLVRISGARRVLEVGTLGGYSTIWLARALPLGGEVVSLEIDPGHAEVARANVAAAGLAATVDIRVGRALDLLPALAPPFDLVFLDADKPSNPDYLEWALRLSRPGTVIVGDNVVRGGAVTDAASTDPNVMGTRRFLEMVGAEPRLAATAIQLVGTKGWDGVALAVVLD